MLTPRVGVTSQQVPYAASFVVGYPMAPIYRVGASSTNGKVDMPVASSFSMSPQGGKLPASPRAGTLSASRQGGELPGTVGWRALGDGRIAPLSGKPERKPLPLNSDQWTQFESDLYWLSHGRYNPSKMALRRRSHGKGLLGTGVGFEVSGRVSVVVPTMSSRQRYHDQLWANFQAQTWEDKELIVVETYTDVPSAFLAQKAIEDSRLVHVCFKCTEDDDFGVGLKRNMTLHLASGEYCVNFDDDDIYAPTYIAKMVGEMKSRGLVGLTLGTWYNYFVHAREVGYSDPMQKWDQPLSQLTQQDLDEVLYGYGFSYVHRRRAALALPYPDVDFAEDAPFFLKLREVCGANRVVWKKDTDGLCMHLVHRANSAGDMPILKKLDFKEADVLDVGPIFRSYLQRNESLLAEHLRSIASHFDLAVQTLGDFWRPKIEPCDSSSPSSKPAGHRRVKTC